MLWSRTGPSGEDFALATPRKPDPSKPAIIFCPQAGGQAEFFTNPISGDKTERAKLFHRLAREGFVCATSDFGGQNQWGNDNATGRIKQVADYLHTLSGVKPGSILMIGTSMGNASALAFARRYPDSVAGVLSIFGVCDVHEFYEMPEFRNDIASAWGVVPPAPLPAIASPTTYLTEIADLPWRGWTAADDSVIAEQGTAFATALGSNAQHTTVPSGGHTDGIFAHIPYADILDFFEGLS